MRRRRGSTVEALPVAIAGFQAACVIGISNREPMSIQELGYILPMLTISVPGEAKTMRRASEDSIRKTAKGMTESNEPINAENRQLSSSIQFHVLPNRPDLLLIGKLCGVNGSN